MSIEIIDPSAEYARNLTDRIKIAVEGAWQLIIEAYQERAWSTLGYTSWDEYCTREFGTSRLKLPREDRREQVASMREAGLSIRAIASATGASDQTVQNDLRSGVVNHYTSPVPLSDEPGRITKLTGANSVADAPTDVPDLPVNPQTGEVYEAGDAVHGSPEAPVTVTETHTVKIVTGLDGKEYKTTPKEPRRTSILDDARNAGWQLRKAVERLERIHTDDRYQKNKAEILAALQPHLDFANEVFTDL